MGSASVSFKDQTRLCQWKTQTQKESKERRVSDQNPTENTELVIKILSLSLELRWAENLVSLIKSLLFSLVDYMFDASCF